MQLHAACGAISGVHASPAPPPPPPANAYPPACHTQAKLAKEDDRLPQRPKVLASCETMGQCYGAQERALTPTASASGGGRVGCDQLLAAGLQAGAFCTKE